VEVVFVINYSSRANSSHTHHLEQNFFYFMLFLGLNVAQQEAYSYTLGRASWHDGNSKELP
jgi:hypothetical protein